MKTLFFLLFLSCIIHSMERPPVASQRSPKISRSEFQEGISHPASPSSSDGSATPSGSGKRKEREPIRALKKPRGQQQSFSIAYYLQHNPQEILSRIQGSTLDLSHMNLASLDGLLKIPGISHIRNLSFAHNHIREIHREDFSGLSHLISLDLSSNLFEFLTTDSFAQLENLTHLFLNDNIIRTIQHDAFAGLNNLKHLSLAHNRLQEIYPQLFTGVPHLEQLDLNNNQIKNIEPHAFSSLAFLKKLKLNKNQLTKLTGPMFEGTKFQREQIRGRDKLSALTELDLRDNKLTEIPTSILAHLPQIEILLLANNMIAQLTAQNITALKKASTLKSLDLVNNKLKDADLKKLQDALPRVKITATVAMETTHAVEEFMGQFAAAKSMSDIEQKLIEEQEEAEEFARTSLTRLHGSPRGLLNDENFDFRSLIHGTYGKWYELNNLNLTSLDGLLEIPYIHDVFRIYLHKNKLKTVPANAFAGLTQLEDIHLSSNQIETFDPHAFDGLLKLDSVYLDANRIVVLTPEMMKQFKNIKGLILSDNNISQLPPYIFKDLTQLKSLWLGHNSLTQLTPEMLVGLENLESLALPKTQFTYLDPVLFKPLKKLKHLNLAAIPLSPENKEAIKKALPGVYILF
ncbi:MAG: hypothetical protein AMXMBFR12_01700 [Candidatus Babeliales bacterium]